MAMLLAVALPLVVWALLDAGAARGKVAAAAVVRAARRLDRRVGLARRDRSAAFAGTLVLALAALGDRRQRRRGRRRRRRARSPSNVALTQVPQPADDDPVILNPEFGARRRRSARATRSSSCRSRTRSASRARRESRNAAPAVRTSGRLDAWRGRARAGGRAAARSATGSAPRSGSSSTGTTTSLAERVENAYLGTLLQLGVVGRRAPARVARPVAPSRRAARPRSGRLRAAVAGAAPACRRRARARGHAVVHDVGRKPGDGAVLDLRAFLLGGADAVANRSSSQARRARRARGRGRAAASRTAPRRGASRSRRCTRAGRATTPRGGPPAPQREHRPGEREREHEQVDALAARRARRRPAGTSPRARPEEPRAVDVLPERPGAARRRAGRGTGSTRARALLRVGAREVARVRVGSREQLRARRRVAVRTARGRARNAGSALDLRQRRPWPSPCAATSRLKPSPQFASTARPDDVVRPGEPGDEQQRRAARAPPRRRARVAPRCEQRAASTTSGTAKTNTARTSVSAPASAPAAAHQPSAPAPATARVNAYAPASASEPGERLRQQERARSASTTGRARRAAARARPTPAPHQPRTVSASSTTPSPKSSACPTSASRRGTPVAAAAERREVGRVAGRRGTTCRSGRVPDRRGRHCTPVRSKKPRGEDVVEARAERRRVRRRRASPARPRCTCQLSVVDGSADERDVERARAPRRRPRDDCERA